MGKKFTLSLLVLAAMLLALPIQAQNAFVARKALPSKVMKGIHGQELKKGYTFAAKNVKEVVAQARLTAEQKAEIDRIELAKLWENNMERIQDGKFSRLVCASFNESAQSLKLNAPVSNRFNAPKKAETKDEHGIITEPGEGVVKVYTVTGSGYKYSGQATTQIAQSGTTQIVESEDGTVYIKDIVSTYKTGAWVKGTKNGNTITVPAKQPINYNSDYDATLSPRWAAGSGISNPSAADETAENFTFVVDEAAGTISLQGTSENLFMAVLWDDDDSYSGNGVYGTVYTYDHDYAAPTTVTVTPPAGLETETWYASGHTYTQSTGQVAFESTIKVGFDGNDVYLQGVFSNFPDAWMKGTISGSTVTFAGLQVQGTYASTLTIYATGGDNSGLIDYVMTYDAENKVLSSENALFANAAEDQIYFLTYVTDLTISQAAPAEEEATTAAPVEVLPYENALTTEDLFGEFGVIDSNKDGKTWKLSAGKGAQYSYSSSNDGDDWLISPAVKLEAGKKYHVAIDAAAALAKYPERVEVKLGAEPKASAMTTEVIPATVVDFADFQTLENEAVVVSETGYYHIGIHAISDADQLNLYVNNFLVEAGVDEAAPAAVTDFNVVATEGKIEATISFKAPTLTAGGEELASIDSINVKRDGKVIASLKNVAPGAEAQYVDAAEDLTIGAHVYQVVAYNAVGIGVKSEEKSVFLSAVLSVPTSFDLTKKDVFDLFQVIDANEDDETWSWNSSYGANYSYSTTNAANDYLITAPVKFEAGKNYKVIVTANAASTSYPEAFRVLVGKEATVDGLNILAADTTWVETKELENYEADVNVTEDGTYYVAIQAVSPANMWRLNVTKLSIEKGADPKAPAVVDEYKVLSGVKGANWAEVSFKAPAKAIDGTDLTENMSIDILRGDSLIQTLEDVAPAEFKSYRDEDVESGFNTYQVIARNSYGPGKKSDKVKVFVGIDTPADLAGLTATDNATSIGFAWDKVGFTGVNGGYVDPATVDYEVWSLKLAESMFGYSLEYDELKASVTDTDNYTLEENTDEGAQDYKYWGVQPVNNAGVGGAAIASLLVGAPYELPLVEGFAGKSFHYIWEYSDNAGVFVSEESTDEDNVALQLVALDEPGTVTFTSGKVSLKNVANPTLLFDVKSSTISKINVIGSVAGAEFTTIKADAPVTSEYTTVKVPLNDLKNARFVQVGFSADFATPTVEDIDWETSQYVYTWGDLLNIDNIRIVDLYEHDLEVALSAPASVVAGSAAKLQVKVSNNAENTANNFTLNLSAGDKVVASTIVSEPLKGFSSVNYEAMFQTTVFEEAGDVTLKAEIVYDNDLNLDNNTDEAVITVKESTAAAPTDLAAQQANDGTVTLSWNAPAADAAQEITEDFASYENGANETGLVGDWTLINNNGKTKGSLFQDLQLANDGLVKAWQVFNPTAYGITNPKFNGPNGSLDETYLISGYNIEGQSYPDNDDWLISPVLPGVAQEISFSIGALSVEYGPSSYEVLASSTDANVASFTKVAEATLSTAGWVNATAQLPEGTKYFAIRNNTAGDGALCVVLDNIKYQTSGGSAPVSYNVYVDQAAVANTAETTAELKDLASGNYVFAVTAVYANGTESKPVTATIDVVNAINEILNSGKSFTIYSVDGKLINREATSLNGLKGAYIINNKKVVLK